MVMAGLNTFASIAQLLLAHEEPSDTRRERFAG